ncbi:MAG: hypothetical protein GY810_13305 [Aureispira sp.]|nr:hypothetical protein [Aureispira sp.]
MAKKVIRVGKWDCNSCGQIGIHGPSTKCPKCGSTRPQNVKFYLDDNAPIVRDVRKIREAYAGADWICDHCQAHNKAKDTHCKSCGNIRDGLDRTTLDVVGRTAKSRTKTKRAKGLLAWWDRQNMVTKTIIAIVLIYGLTFMYRTTFKSKPTEYYSFANNRYKTEIPIVSRMGKVENFYFKTSVLISYDTTHQLEGWDLPEGAYKVKSKKEVKEYESRKVGEKDVTKTGNGTSPPRSKRGFRILSKKAKKEKDGYEKVRDGYTTERKRERVKVGTEEYKCGTKNMGNGYFEDKYCSRAVYDYEWVEKRVKKYKKVPKYKKVTYYSWSYIESEPIYKKFPIYAQYHRYKLDVRDIRRVELTEQSRAFRYPLYSLRKKKNEVVEGQEQDFGLSLFLLRDERDFEKVEEVLVNQKQWKKYNRNDQVILFYDKKGEPSVVTPNYWMN